MNAVSSHAERLWLPAAAVRDSSLRSQRSLVVAISALIVAAAAAWLTLSAPQSTNPPALTIFRVYLLLAHVGIGLLWWHKRPGHGIGTVLIIGGFLWGATALQGASAPIVFAIGVLAEGLASLTTFYLAVVFPQGRPTTTVERALVGIGGVVAVLLVPITMMTSPQLIGGGGPLSMCAVPCPPNAFFVADAPVVAAALGAVSLVLALLAILGVVVLWIVRLRRATPARARALAPVAIASLVFFPVFFMYHVSRWALSLPPDVQEDLAWLLVGARLAFPLAFLVALVQADLWAGSARLRLLNELLQRPSGVRWNEAIAQSLNDPAARVGYREPDGANYLDASGVRLGGSRDAGRLTVNVERGGEVVARIVTDPALAHEPELLAAAADATLVAVEKGHLETAFHELEGRVAEAGDEERRRIQRDLHDSAQQRLIALRVHVALASEKLDNGPDERDLVERIGRELDEALDELRSVARGSDPISLERYGIGSALREVAGRLSPLIEVKQSHARRYPRETERAAYFCCSEAMQNAMKHAGHNARVWVTLADGDGVLTFQVDDDGLGFDRGTVNDGTGLANMEERVTQLGGHLEIGSRPGGGTRITGTLPV